MKTMLEPRMVAASVQRRTALAHPAPDFPEVIMASSQGKWAIIWLGTVTKKKMLGKEFILPSVFFTKDLALRTAAKSFARLCGLNCFLDVSPVLIKG
jgi:hypothetical protein